MRIIKEHINEKFIKDSDPITDMGIGLYANINFQNYEDLYEFLFKIIPSLLKIDDIKDIIAKDHEHYFVPEYFIKIKNYSETYMSIGNKKVDTLYAVDFFSFILNNLKN